MLVGGAPTRCRVNFFCTTHFLFENRSLVDFAIGNGDYGGDLEENGLFYVSKLHFALIIFKEMSDGGDLDENGRFP